jgi:hypothetical protein
MIRSPRHTPRSPATTWCPVHLEPDQITGTGSAAIPCGYRPTANATGYVIDSVLMPGSMG